MKNKAMLFVLFLGLLLIPLASQISASNDFAGNSDNFRINAPPDKKGPVVDYVGHYPAIPDNTQTILINCTITDQSGIDSANLQYREQGTVIYTNTTLTQVGITDSYEVSIGPFSSGSNIEYRINATDTLGYNTIEDNNGLNYNFTVVQAPDLTAPTISNVTIDPAQPIYASLVNITCKVTDDFSGVDEVELHYRVNNGSWETVLFNYTTADTYLAIIGPFNISDIVDFYISATDASLPPNSAINDNDGDYFTFTVLENTDSSSLYMFIPIVSIGALILLRRKRRK